MLTGIAATGISVARQSRSERKMITGDQHEGDADRLLHLVDRTAHVAG